MCGSKVFLFEFLEQSGIAIQESLVGHFFFLFSGFQLCCVSVFFFVSIMSSGLSCSYALSNSVWCKNT